METQSTTQEILVGTCSFCKGEFEKKKMTQHLRYCKPRVASMKALEADPTKQKTRILYIQVEGRDKPQYWMHLELPASEPLDTLDTFLRDIWLESGEQRSRFRIGETDYELEAEDGLELREIIRIVKGIPARKNVKNEEIERRGEEEEGNSENVNMQLPAEYIAVLPSDWLAELNKKQPIDDIVSFLKEKQKGLHWNSLPHRNSSEYREATYKLYMQKEALKLLLDQIEDRSMGAQVGKAVKVDQKFYYTYDYGNRTELVLRAVSEREGIFLDEEGHIGLLARNVAPVYACKICGKPATQITCHDFDEEGESYCDTCINDIREREHKKDLKRLKKKESGEARGIYTINDEIKMLSLVPIVNSPRVGICEDDEDDDYHGFY